MTDAAVSTFRGIAHLDLSVSDAEASAAWYQRVLGLDRVRRDDLPGRTMIVLLHRPSGLIVGLNHHHDMPDAGFDERRCGLDHVGFAVSERAELEAWQARLAELEVAHSAVTDADSGTALVFRDPDNIQLELWWTRPRT